MALAVLLKINSSDALKCQYQLRAKRFGASVRNSRDVL